MMGSTDDAKDGKAVAGSIFAAVVVYAVCSLRSPFPLGISSRFGSLRLWRMLMLGLANGVAVPGLLWLSVICAYPGK